MNLKYTHNNYNLKKKLIKNKWTLLSIIHTKTDLKVLLDGGVHFSLDSEFSDSNNTDIMAFHSIKCINGVLISNKSGPILYLLKQPSFLFLYFVNIFQKMDLKY